ncbi:hypothetical protein [Desulfosporosinus meridiei]|uniref:Uncharacterized protein n=1 Tax=Desulfosporosinus meridiei (strain ATCC BAA-275 / DSM 13257 / KCTC 12902 / NCIMB 13706 / S10) TaxID=768704 RepID=J7J581_DESMD|nr:hypothetical protein [Desulfosporosinus meridiei]AFQ46418.1 hypothetical protein Desmer_4616 [Desulfosporosinus meridiei DSM 13257]
MENGSENQKLSALYSWWAIILFLFLFFPIGLYLIFKRISLDKKTLYPYSIAKVIGWIFVFIGSTGVISTYSSTSQNFVGKTAAIMFLIGGITLIIWGVKLQKQSLRYSKYSALIIDQNISSLDNIASATSLNYDEVKKDLQKMLSKNYFIGAYINESSGEILLPKSKANRTYNQSSSEKVPIVCKSCGANNIVIAGRVSECEYCGSPIN